MFGWTFNFASVVREWLKPKMESSGLGKIFEPSCSLENLGPSNAFNTLDTVSLLYIF